MNGGRCIRRAGPTHDLTADYAQRISRTTAATPQNRAPRLLAFHVSVTATRPREPRLIRGFDGKAMGVVPGLQ